MAENNLDSLLYDRNSNQNVRRKWSSNYLTVMFSAVLLLSRRCTYTIEAIPLLLLLLLPVIKTKYNSGI